MAITPESIWTNYSGAFPDVVAVNSSGAGATDGSEFTAAYLNNFVIGPWQAILDYGGVTPNGVAEAAGASQIITALQLGNGIGPGFGNFYYKADAPAVTGDRVLLLANQTVLIASYPLLVAACYVGDGSNATAPYFYKSSDSGGVTRSTAGTYFTLPPTQPLYTKQYVAGNTYNGVALNVTGTLWTTTRGVFTPYKTINGAIRLKFNIAGEYSSGAANNFVNTVSGVTSKNIAAYYQSFDVSYQSHTTLAPEEFYAGQILPNTSGFLNVQLPKPTTYTGIWGFSGDIELESWPTWADVFDYPMCITY